MASLLSELANPELVAVFQRWCGVQFVSENSEEIAKAHHLQAGISEQHTVSSSSSSSQNGICPAVDTARSIAKPTANTPLSPKKSATINNNNDCSKDSHHCTNGIGHLNGFDYHYLGNNGFNGISKAVAERLNNGDLLVKRCQDVKKDVCANGATTRKVKVVPSHSSQCEGNSPHRVSIRWPLIYYWARVGAFLGNEEFYLTGLPFMIWAVDSAMLRQTIAVWWLVMYLGQAGKDYFAWPRPPSPPVVRLETEHLAEYSMPSTHAMAGTAIPLLLSKILLQRYQLPTVPVLGLAFLWCFTTCLSRLYLGVHTVLDVLSGFLVSLTLYVLVTPLVSGYDLYQQTHPLSPLVLVLTSLALCTICYPSCPGVKTTGKSDAITTTAVVVGLGVGFWLNYQLGYTKVASASFNLPVYLPTLTWVLTSLLQFVVGVLVVYGVKVVTKRLTVRFFSFFFGLDRPDAQHPGVMVGSTYTTYLCLGLVIAFFDPLLFAFLGIGRPAFYLEVL